MRMEILKFQKEEFFRVYYPERGGGKKQDEFLPHPPLPPFSPFSPMNLAGSLFSSAVQTFSATPNTLHDSASLMKLRQMKRERGKGGQHKDEHTGTQ